MPSNHASLFLSSFRTAETIASFIQPLMIFREMEKEKPPDWVAKLTSNMQNSFGGPDQHAHRTIEKMVLTANSGRIYFEQLYLHPVRLSLTFTQEWMDWNQSADTVMIFQFIRGMVRLLIFALQRIMFLASLTVGKGIDCECASCFYIIFRRTCF